MLLAIAYVWIKEGTYDKEYVRTHVVGFDKFSDYVTGKEDGEPKTPEWAAGKTGIKEWTIKALARDWAKKITTVVHFYGGSYIRGPYSHEPARLESCLLGMQGLGKPGVHQYARFAGIPRQKNVLPDQRLLYGREETKGIMEKDYKSRIWSGRLYIEYSQLIPKPGTQAILSRGQQLGQHHLHAPTKDQFIKYTYPFPKKGGPKSI